VAGEERRVPQSAAAARIARDGAAYAHAVVGKGARREGMRRSIASRSPPRGAPRAGSPFPCTSQTPSAICVCSASRMPGASATVPRSARAARASGRRAAVGSTLPCGCALIQSATSCDRSRRL
jgi:hypothetical protein